MMYALFDDHGEPLGFYEKEADAIRDLALLGNPDDVGIVMLSPKPKPSVLQQAALRMLTRLSETLPGGYR